MMGNNSEDELKELVFKYVSCDEKSAEINDERKQIRDRIIELGHDSRAFQDKITRLKSDRKKKEGYDESYAVLSKLMDGLDKDNLFSWQDKREAAKEAVRAEAKALREKEKKSSDSFKPATERKPASEGKVLKKGGKDVGAEQAAAYQKAHGTAQ